MFEYSFLHQLFLLFGSHVTLLEMERNICLLDHDGSCQLILLFEYSAKDPCIAIILASLHLFIIKQYKLFKFYELAEVYISQTMKLGEKVWKMGMDYITASGCGSIRIVNYQLFYNLKMQPNVATIRQASQINFHPHTQKFIAQVPVPKQIDGTTTPIKRIQNFSYALSDQIGLGLTSRVFKGKNDLTGLPVAIKCIDLKSQSDHLSQEFIKQEITTLEKIKNAKTSHLLKLQAVMLTANNLYIVTEFCEGKDMGKILRQKKLLSQSQAQTVMKQTILGYRELYGLGLIHRDLKLSNLLVMYGKIKIADFGFAISEDKCNTSFSYNAGSPKYMPPESLKYNMYSFKSDAWALGVIAYQLVYGHAPWQSNDQAKLYDLIMSKPIQGLFESQVPVSDHYKTFIFNCLKHNTNQRASPDFIFNYAWPSSIDYVSGFEEEKKKPPEIIKVPGKNYAIYSSSNQIKYQSKQLDTDDFVNNPSIPTQFILLSQLNYCRFLINILKGIKSINNYQGNQLLAALVQEIVLTVQILTKGLGEVTCMQKNRYEAPNFDAYIKTGEWQNLKQLIIRYDIQFRADLQPTQPLQKKATIPQTSILPQTISYLKKTLPQNSRLVDKLITYLQIRQILAASNPMQFAQKVKIAQITKQALIPDQSINNEAIFNRVVQRLTKIGL